MKKTVFILLASLMSFVMASKAQSTKTSLFDNTFIGAGVGTNVVLDKGFVSNPTWKAPALNTNIQLGKWMSPLFGLRIGGSYGSLHSFNTEGTRIMAHQKLWTMQASGLFDLTNYFREYKSSNFWNLIVSAGGGANFVSHTKIGQERIYGNSKKYLSLNLGLINTFKLCENLDVAVEVGLSNTPDNLNPLYNTSNRYAGLLQGSLGLVYHFNNSKFESQIIMVDDSHIDFLNDQINTLRHSNKIAKDSINTLNSELKAYIESGMLVEEFTEPCILEMVPLVVNFDINSSRVSNKFDVSLFDLADFLKTNEDVKLNIVGYASDESGSPAYNMELSKDRANVVARILNKEYGIPTSRMNISWKGDTNLLYKENNWNRAVVMTLE